MDKGIKIIIGVLAFIIVIFLINGSMTGKAIDEPSWLERLFGIGEDVADELPPPEEPLPTEQPFYTTPSVPVSVEVDCVPKGEFCGLCAKYCSDISDTVSYFGCSYPYCHNCATTEDYEKCKDSVQYFGCSYPYCHNCDTPEALEKCQNPPVA